MWGAWAGSGRALAVGGSRQGGGQVEVNMGSYACNALMHHRQELIWHMLAGDMTIAARGRALEVLEPNPSRAQTDPTTAHWVPAACTGVWVCSPDPHVTLFQAQQGQEVTGCVGAGAEAKAGGGGGGGGCNALSKPEHSAWCASVCVHTLS